MSMTLDITVRSTVFMVFAVRLSPRPVTIAIDKQDCIDEQGWASNQQNNAQRIQLASGLKILKQISNLRDQSSRHEG